jgi:hypothetical protein
MTRNTSCKMLVIFCMFTTSSISYCYSDYVLDPQNARICKSYYGHILNTFTPIDCNAIYLLPQNTANGPAQCVFLLHSCCSARVKVALQQVVYVFAMASRCMKSLKSSDQLARSTKTEGEYHKPILKLTTVPFYVTVTKTL